MTEEDKVVADLQAAIKELPEADQERVHACVYRIQSIVTQFGDRGFIALALVGALVAQEQAKQEAGG